MPANASKPSRVLANANPASPRRLADVVALPRPEPEDNELVARACDGEEWAHEAIYRRYVQRISRVAQRMLRDPAEVDDVVQETFLIAFETLGKLADPAALRGWLTGIAVHRVHRRFRWQRVIRLWTSAEVPASLEAQISPDASPDQRAELTRIDRVLHRLPVALRTAWVLRFVLGDSLDDIAIACACSVATVKRRLDEVKRHVAAHIAGGSTP